MEWGLIIQVYVNGAAGYCKASFPPQEVQDLQAMCIEQSFPTMKDPKSLLDAAIDCKPLADNIFTKYCEGVFVIKEWDKIEALEEWPWHKIFDIPNFKEQLKQARKQMRRRIGSTS